VPLDPPSSDSDQLYLVPSFSLFIFHKSAIILTKTVKLGLRAGAEMFKAICDFRTHCAVCWTRSEQKIRRAELEARRQPQRLLPSEEAKKKSKRA
jgi:hypothetical protein